MNLASFCLAQTATFFDFVEWEKMDCDVVANLKFASTIIQKHTVCIYIYIIIYIYRYNMDAGSTQYVDFPTYEVNWASVSLFYAAIFVTLPMSVF